MNAAQVTREVKRQLQLAALPAYEVHTRHTRLSEKSPGGRLFGWLAIVYGLDSETIEVVELVMGNLTGLIKTMRSDDAGFLGLVLEDRS